LNQLLASAKSHRRRRGEHVAGDDHERHLQRERDQVPESAAPGIDRVEKRGGRRRQRRADHENRCDEGEDERVWNPSLGPVGQRERGARDWSRLFCHPEWRLP
jgi:hypothetical protein